MLSYNNLYYWEPFSFDLRYEQVLTFQASGTGETAERHPFVGLR
jgi:hypothetical protein